MCSSFFVIHGCGSINTDKEGRYATNDLQDWLSLRVVFMAGHSFWPLCYMRCQGNWLQPNNTDFVTQCHCWPPIVSGFVQAFHFLFSAWANSERSIKLSSRDWSVKGLFSDFRVIFNAYIVAVTLLTDEQSTKLQVLNRRLTQTLRAVWFGQNEEEE